MAHYHEEMMKNSTPKGFTKHLLKLFSGDVERVERFKKQLDAEGGGAPSAQGGHGSASSS
jgi:hypothetical protein